MKFLLPAMLLFGIANCINLSAQTGVNLGNLTKYHMVFTNGSSKVNWQGATKGFIGDVAVDGITANETTSGTVPFAGTIYTNSGSLSNWQSIVNNNAGQATAAFNQTTLIAGLKADLENAFAQINALPVTPGYNGVASTSLDGLNTADGISKTYVINITSGLQVSQQIRITGDANDFFILRWDTDANFSNGYNGQVKFQSGGAIVPQGALLPNNFIHVAGDINSSGGGSNPASPYPQGPRANNGSGALITGGSNFSGGGFFTGYWLTTGSPTITGSGQPYGTTASQSNAIFVGGLYTKTTEISLTSGTSGVYVASRHSGPLGSIGDRVWSDVNKNGMQDLSEYGVPGVTVHLRNAQGTTIATTTTDAEGFYSFNFLPAGTYTVVFPTSFSGAPLTLQKVGTNNNIDSDPSPATGITASITLAAGQAITNIDAGYAPVAPITGEKCFASTNLPDLVNARVVYTIDPLSQTVTLRTILAKSFVDNTYGDNRIGWPQGHSFMDLVESDKLQIALFDAQNNKKLDFEMDYISPSNTVASGYRSLGVSGGEGAMIFGDASNILRVTTSLDVNFNHYGYVLTNHSPATDAAYNVNNAYVNWIYEVWYEATIKLDAFGAAGFGNVLIPGLHASPSKTRTNKEPVYPANCVDVLCIGNQLFLDNNNNGIFDAGDTVLPGLTVNLYRDMNRDNIPDGPAIATTVSGNDGKYLFVGLAPGSYIAGVVLPHGLTGGVTTATSSFPDNDVDNDNNGISIVNGELRSNYLTVTVGDEPTDDSDGPDGNMTLDFGLKYLPANLSIGNQVWYDANNNGVLDAGEAGLAGVTVRLYVDNNGDNIPDGPAIATTTTNAAGTYQFAGVPAGKYIVGVTLPAGYVNGTTGTTDVATDNQNDGVTTTGGEVRTNGFTITASTNNIDFGLIGANNLGNLVWNDANNNGLFDAGEPGVANATVYLYTDNNGDNIPDGAPIATTTTNASGIYSFTNLPNGKYIVGVAAQAAGYGLGTTTATSANPDNDVDNDNNGITLSAGIVRSNAITLAAGTEPTTDGDGPNGNLTLDFGLKALPANLSIGNQVWYDVNNNGILNPGEPGIAGAIVKLYRDDNNDNIADGPAIATVTTDANGNYLFTGVTPGSYIVGVTLPTSYVNGTNGTTDVATDNQNDGVTTTGGEVRTNGFTIAASTNNIDFGLIGTTNLGNLVWNDVNNNGLFDAGEPGVASATVYLYTDNNGDNIPDGAPIATTTTNASGIYSFSNLPNGKYIVGVAAQAAGYGLGTTTATSANPDNDVDNDNNGITLSAGIVRSNAITLAAGTEPTTDGDGPNGNLTLDFGLKALPANLSIGNQVWYDVNNNGILNPGEPGIAGAVVKLYRDDNNDNIADGPAIATVTTDANGNYLFTGVTPGSYIVGVTLPTGYVNGTNGTTDVATDNQNDGVTTTGGEVRTNGFAIAASTNNIDFGLIGTNNLGNLVWWDANNNGLFNAGEPGVANATVYLYTDNNGDNIPDGAPIATTTTNASGIYSFTNLPNGKYIVGVAAQAAGYGLGTTTATSANPDNDVDNDNNGVTLSAGIVRSNAITLAAGTEPTTDGDGPNGNLTLDLGLKGINGVGNFVWDDLNGNGLQDAGEPGIKGVTVTLTLPNGTVLTTTTNNNGEYGFSNLPPGNYSINFSIPQYYNPTLTKTGSNTETDSDPDINGNATFVLLPNTINNSIDAGFIWDIDTDDDGIINTVESGGYDALKDCDGDGIPNYLDQTPGCPVPAGNDPWGNPYKPLVWTDCNGDGVNDFFDFDRDGVINQLDLDSDNDGITDAVETRDPNLVDVNKDGIVDGGDDDHDGLRNSADGTPNTYGGPGLLPQDLDRDGLPNFLDLDSDGDGITDLTEARGIFVANGVATGNDSDGDGVKDIYDNINGHGATGIIPADNDGDGKPNPYDIDSDNDGITDNVEGQPTCSYREPLGTDTDKDGVDDAYDLNTNMCVIRSSGITPYDKDADGTPDIYDLDTDNDGALDVNEGSGIRGDFVTNFNDTDEDGLIDQFDAFNIKTATSNFKNNVTHSNMGANGSFDGPLPKGSIAELPQSAPGNCGTGADRDWRNISVLPVTLVNFSGKLNNAVTELSWLVAGQQNIDRYVVERSTDGRNFTAIGAVKATGNTNQAVTYTFNDNVAGVAASDVYYRISMVETNGSGKYSNIVSLKLIGKNSLSVGVYPNPAVNFVNVKLNTPKDGSIAIRVIDAYGKVVSVQQSRVNAGANLLNLQGVSKLPAGSYMMQVIVDGQVLNTKFVVAR